MAARDVAPPTGERLDLLKRLGFAELDHDSHVPFLSHLLGTRRLLVRWGERPELCDGGLFHSAYGTEYFAHDGAADRDEVRAVIGAQAEAIAWTWCTIRRDTLEPTDPFTAIDRHTGQDMELGAPLAGDIATLWAADTVEQIARMSVEERAFARGITRVLHLASPAAQEAVAGVLSLVEEC